MRTNFSKVRNENEPQNFTIYDSFTKKEVQFSTFPTKMQTLFEIQIVSVWSFRICKSANKSLWQKSWINSSKIRVAASHCGQEWIQNVQKKTLKIMKYIVWNVGIIFSMFNPLCMGVYLQLLGSIHRYCSVQRHLWSFENIPLGTRHESSIMHFAINLPICFFLNFLAYFTPLFNNLLVPIIS